MFGSECAFGSSCVRSSASGGEAIGEESLASRLLSPVSAGTAGRPFFLGRSTSLVVESEMGLASSSPLEPLVVEEEA